MADRSVSVLMGLGDLKRRDNEGQTFQVDLLDNAPNG